MAPNTYIMRYNYFVAKDTGNGITKDANSPQQTMAVKINGSQDTGGG